LDSRHENKNELIDAFPRAKLVDGDLFIFSNDKKENLIDWVNESK